MTYTTRNKTNGVHFQRIQPLDARIVRVACSVKVREYKKLYPDTLLTLYSYLALSGTKNRTKEELHAFLQQEGIELHATAGGGYIHFEMTTRARTITTARNILEEILFESTFPAREYKITLARMQEENREAHDNAKKIAHIQFVNALYPKGSCMREETLVEQKEILNSLSRKDLQNLVRDLRTSEWFVSSVSDQKTAKEFSILTERMSAEATCVERMPIAEKDRKTSKIFTTVPGKTNVEIQIGNTLPIEERHEDFVALQFGIQVLGKVGGFSGRLMSTVREREGLTYGIYARALHQDTVSTGHWHIFTFFTARDLAQGIASTMRELKKIVTKGITKNELRVFKELLANQFLIAHESNGRRLRLYHKALLSGKSEQDLNEDIERMHALTAPQVHRALKAYLDPETLVISGAGPVDTKGAGILPA